MHQCRHEQCFTVPGKAAHYCLFNAVPLIAVCHEPSQPCLVSLSTFAINRAFLIMCFSCCSALLLWLLCHSLGVRYDDLNRVSHGPRCNLGMLHLHRRSGPGTTFGPSLIVFVATVFAHRPPCVPVCWLCSFSVVPFNY